MASVNIEGVGVVHFPDDMTPEQITQAIETEILPNSGQRKQFNVEEMSPFEKVLSRIPHSPMMDYLTNRLRGGAMGAADPSVGLFQAGANLTGFGDRVNRAIDAKEAEYQAERKRVGAEGFDFARTFGNVASPVNLMVAGSVPVRAGMTVPQLALQGGKVGAIGGLSMPVTDIKPEQSYAMTKGAQVGLGTIAGAAMTPVMTKVMGAMANKIAALAGRKDQTAVYRIIVESLEENGINRADISDDAFNALKTQVSAALKSGKKLDPAALLRHEDFKALGMKATAGQLTRDPTQFAAERNIRSVQGVGEPLMNRFTEQNQQLHSAVGRYAAGAKEPFQAGQQLDTALGSIDEAMRRKVSALYGAARESSGKGAELPMHGLAQDFASVVEDFAEKVPTAIKNRFSAFGIGGGKQTKLYTVEEADKLLKLINMHHGSDAATNAALGRLREAVKKSVLDVAEDVFAEGRKAAAARFDIQDMVPALKAVSRGTVDPDDLINRFVIGGKVNDLKAMAGLLKTADPDSYAEIRRQIGAYLQRAAFGADAVGDAAFTPKRFNETLRKIGTDKLSAFFDPGEVAQIQRIGRVGAYINQAPSASPVQTNPNSWMLGPLKSIVESVVPGGRYMTAAASVLGNTANQNDVVRRALGGVPMNPVASLTPEQEALLLRLGIGAGATGGLLAASPLR